MAELNEDFHRHRAPAYEQWLNLFQADSAATIQQHPDFLFHDLRTQSELRDRPGYFLSRSMTDGTSWAAGLVPKTVTLPRAVGLGLRRRVRGYRLVGNRLFGHGSGELQRELWEELETFLSEQDIDFLLIEDLLRPSPTWDLLMSQPYSRYRLDSLTNWTPRSRVRLPKNSDDYWRSFSKNARKQNRKLLDDSRRYTLWRATEVPQVADLLTAVKKVSENSWQANRLRIHLCQDETKFELLTFLARQRALRSYVLFDGSTPIAFEIDYQFNGYLMSEDAAYDKRHAKHSPGRSLLLRVLEDLFEHDSPNWYDFDGGDWDYKRRFANDQSESVKAWLVKRNLRFGLISALLRTGRDLRSSAHRLREYLRPKIHTPKTQRAEA